MAAVWCSLDDRSLRTQLGRYRAVAEAATVIVRDQRRLAVRVGEDVPDSVVDELVAVERECCPFFELRWESAERRLAVSVADAEHEPALAVIGYALGLEAARVIG